MERLPGKVAVITGGATGLGAAMATRMAAEGASVAVLDTDKDGGAQVVAALSADEAKWVTGSELVIDGGYTAR